MIIEEMPGVYTSNGHKKLHLYFLILTNYSYNYSITHPHLTQADWDYTFDTVNQNKFSNNKNFKIMKTKFTPAMANAIATKKNFAPKKQFVFFFYGQYLSVVLPTVKHKTTIHSMVNMHSVETQPALTIQLMDIHH